MAHPVRLRMLSLMTGTPMSAAELARELDITQANASYHLRSLVRAGLVTPAGEERVRGGVAKRYRYDVDAPMPEMKDAAGEPMFAEALGAEMVRRSRRRRPGARGITTDAEVWVDPKVFTDARDAIADATRRLHVEARAPRSEGTVRVSVTVAMFEMDEEPA